MSPHAPGARPGAPRRRLPWAALALAGALLLSGCGSVDAGSAGERAFAETFSDDPAVAELDLGSSNDLPWVGSVSGTVVAREETDEAALRDLVDRIGAYAAEAEGASVSVDVRWAGITFPVMTSRERNDAVIDLAVQLRADDRLEQAVLDLRYDGISSVELTAADPEAAFALSAAVPAALAELDLGGTVELAILSSADGTRIEGEPGAWLAQGEQVWRAVQRELGPAAVVLTPESVELRVEREQDVSAATQLAQAALAGSPLRLTVSSELLRVAEGSTGTRARDLFARLRDETRAVIETAWTDDEALHLTVASLASIPGLAREVAELPEAGRFSTIALMSGDGVAVPQGQAAPFTVYASPADLRAAAAAGLLLARTRGVGTVEIARDRVEVSAAVEEDRAGDFAGALKASARPGQWVCVDTGQSGNVCATAADTITLEDVPNEEHPSARGFVEAWNAAPPVGAPPR